MANFSQKSNNLWMINFTDLTMLLIAFFLLIYASSNVKDIAKTEDLAEKNDKIKIFSGKTEDLDYLQATIKNYLPQTISITRANHKLVIRAKISEILDDSFNLSAAGTNFFSALSLHLADIENNILVYHSVILERSKSEASKQVYNYLQKTFKLADLIKNEVKTQINVSLKITPQEKDDISDEYLEIIINDY